MPTLAGVSDKSYKAVHLPGAGPDFTLCSPGMEHQGTLTLLRPPELGGAEAIAAEAFRGPARMLHENYLLTIALGGVVEWRNRGRTYLAHPGSIALMEPGEIHELGRYRSPTITQRLLFVPPALVRAAAGGTAAPLSLRSYEPRLPALFAALDRLHQTLAGPAAALERESRFHACLEIFLAGCVDGRFRPEPPDPDAGRLQKVRERLEDDCAEDHRLDQLAAEAGMSKFRFLRAFKARFGVPPHAYQVEARLRRSLRLLRSGVPPAVAAADLGFADQSHFTRLFRRRMGVTPAVYQRA